MTEQTMEKEFPRFRPATDILEKDECYHLFLDMPGVDKKDLEIDFSNNELVIRGKTSYPPMKGKILSAEFDNGEYVRSFTLSDTIDPDKIKAGFKNGVLEVHLPKREEVKPRKIPIAES